jgi:DNA replication protein DnaC
MNENNHASKCVLADRCVVANGKSCNFQCPHFIATNSRLRASGVPADYRLVTLANSPARASQPAVYKSVDAYVGTFERQFEAVTDNRIKSLYLYSASPGTGKTTTASAILNEYLTQHYIGSLQRSRQALQQPAYMLDVNAWQTLFNEFNRSNIPADIGEEASRQYYRQMQAAKTAPFAVLDDIGVRNATEAFRGDLHAVINARVTNGLPTVYTSNLPLAEMERVFDARLYDRMRDQCAELAFVGGSKRGMRK